MPQLHTTFTAIPEFKFEEVGRNRATTFTGLCAKHDAELFAPIEKQALNIEDPQHLFLVAYRAVLKEAHSSLKAGIDVQSTYLHGGKVGLFSTDTPSAPGMLAVDQMMAAYLVHQIREPFEAAYLASNWTALTHLKIDLGIAPCIAVNSLFTTDIWSEETDSPASACLNVLPYRNGTVAVFSSLSDHAKHVRTAFSRILEATGDYQRYEIAKLILKKCENIVISPSHFDRFSRHQRAAVLEYFTRNTGSSEYDTDDPLLNIFTAQRPLR